MEKPSAWREKNSSKSLHFTYEKVYSMWPLTPHFSQPFKSLFDYVKTVLEKRAPVLSDAFFRGVIPRMEAASSKQFRTFLEGFQRTPSSRKIACVFGRFSWKSHAGFR